MDILVIRQLAEQAYREERLPWSLASVFPNPFNPSEWEIHYEAFGRKYHRILVLLTEKSDSTLESLKAELRGFLRRLKRSGRL